MLGSDADAGIEDLEPQSRHAAPGADTAYSHAHFTVFREFEGVADQVQKHLPQPRWISGHRQRRVRRNVAQQFEALLVRGQGQASHRPGHLVFERKHDGLEG